MDLAQLAGLALQHVGGQGAGANGGHGPGANGGHRPGVHGGHGPGRRLGQNRRLRMLALGDGCLMLSPQGPRAQVLRAESVADQGSEAQIHGGQAPMGALMLV